MTRTAPKPPPPAQSRPPAPPPPAPGSALAAPPPPPPTQGGTAGRVGAGMSRVRSGVRGTPGRMRLVSAGLMVLGLILGLAVGQSFWAADGALGRAAENTAQIVRLQEIQTSLVRADALATNAFLVGGLEPPEQRAEYEESIAQAATLLPQAAGAQPADVAVLADLNLAIVGYVDGVSAARANNRQGFPVGAQYLRLASADLRADALPALDALGAANQERAAAEFSAARSAIYLAVAVGVFGLGAIVIALIWLARRTHRYVNVPLAGAELLVLVLLVISAVVLGSVASRVAAVRDGPYAHALAVSDARIAAYDAKANESLTLISRGSGAAFETAWTDSAGVVEQRLSDALAISGDDGDLDGLWTTYATAHREIRDLDDGGNWDQAVAAATSREDGSANAAFDTFASASADVLVAASEEATTALTRASSGLAVWGWLGVLAGVVVSGLAWWGLAQRIEEYR